MGLDMYLYKMKDYKDTSIEDAMLVFNYKYYNDPICKPLKKDVVEFYMQHPCERVCEWQKVNAVHKYFEDTLTEYGINNCEYYQVDKYDLINLIDLCQQVLKEPEKASELLPTTSDFFFDSIDYDSDYLSDIEETIDKINVVLDTTDFDNESLLYYAWW